MDLEKLISSRHELLESGGRDVLKKAYDFEIVEILKSFDIYPYFKEIEKNEGATAVINGKEVIMLGSNNYLGLTTHPEVRKTAAEAALEYGTSMTGSRFLNGTSRFHTELEMELAEFTGKEAGLVFTTGYQANLGVMTALLNENTKCVLDKFDHASIYDGCRMSGAEMITFRHNDGEDLDRILSGIPQDCGILVVVDGVFSMEGDIVKLDKIVQVVKKHGARIMLDDAHGIGVVGEGGRGTAWKFGLTGEVDVIVGTFSKSLASIGGFVSADYKTIEFIKHFGRSMIFSASAPPSAVAAARTALRILKTEPRMVNKLHDNAERLRNGLTKAGFDTGVSVTPIIPVTIGSEPVALCMARTLLDEGVFVNPVCYPAVPKKKAMLRTSVTALHTFRP
ncbi:MAG: pyridoxal phosphate-dependent aminotransferase family protein, partial [Deltaproteobacteria bacterium]|nr:pyridoxal phosphate-dependent aminotransferase family protein [Deltaproteobacteria bacterium]